MEENKTDKSSNSSLDSAQPFIDKKIKKSRFAIPVIAGIILLAGAGAAAFNATTQNSADKIWKDALSNTADGFDEFVVNASNYDAKGLKLDGTFNVKSPVVADGQVSGQWYDKNALLESSIGVSGLRINSEIRSIITEGSDTPDVYVYLDGLETLQGLIGSAQPQVGSIIEQVNGQWVVLDRTLIDQGIARLQQETEVNAEAIKLEKSDIEEISRVSSEVIREYLLTTDSEKAVFQTDNDQPENQGKEEFEGVDTYKYSVTIHKENLKTFATAYKDALKQTQFDEYVTSSDADSKTFEDVIEFDEIIEAIEGIDFSKTKNEAWVDLDRRIIRNIRITPTEQNAGSIGYIEFALPYDGGDTLPFTIRINTGQDEETGNIINAEFVAGYNQVDSSFALSFDIVGTVDGQDIDVSASLDITPSDEEATVEEPENAINVLELLGQMQGGLGDSLLTQTSQLDQLQFDGIEL